MPTHRCLYTYLKMAGANSLVTVSKQLPEWELADHLFRVGRI